MREDEETVLSIDHHEGTAWLSTTRKGVRNRCLSKGWVVAETFNGNDGRERRWLFRMPEEWVRISPKSKAQIDRANAQSAKLRGSRPAFLKESTDKQDQNVPN